MDDHVLIVEAFYGGSHKQLVDVLERDLEGCVKFTLPAKKWHWRARTAALHFSQVIPASESYRVLFCSSVLNLAELVALRPDLAPVKKVLYFHENQLEYPVQKQQDRDFQYGYNQILSCLVADEIYFNSEYNMTSFLSRINAHLKLIPDHRPKALPEKIRPKCHVLYFPINFKELGDCLISKANEKSEGNKETSTERGDMDIVSSYNANRDAYSTETAPGVNMTNNIDSSGDTQIKNADLGISDNLSMDTDNKKVHVDTQCVQSDGSDGLPAAKRQCTVDSISVNVGRHSDSGNATTESTQRPLHIVWPHRWEHDKAPELFFQTLLQLKDEGLPFVVSVLGETYKDVPEIFAEAKEKLRDHIVQWGYLPSRQEYLQTLASADVVISTAKHEFFGVAMIEAAYLGCYPLCPSRLVYPEIFPQCLYNTDNQLLKQLRKFCKSPKHIRAKARNFQLERFDWEHLRQKFGDILSATSKEKQS